MEVWNNTLNTWIIPILNSKVKEIVYHGSPNSISKFNSPEMNEYIKQETTTTGVAGIYFTNKKEIANLYQDLKNGGKNGYVYSVLLNIKNL